MIVYIHSHEMEDRGRTMGRHAAARDIIRIIVPEGTTVTEIVDLVNAEVADAGSIWTMIFNGHGDEARTGAIYFGDWIDSSTVGEFAPLNRLMNRTGRGVELHCCRAGSSETMLVNMARAFGVRVTAATANQIGPGRALGPIPSPFGDYHGVIEGQTVIAFPNGTVLYSETE